MFQLIIAVVFAALIGLTFCFAGYRVFLVLLPVWGFFGGFWLGAEGTSLILGQGFLATTLGWVVGFVIGLLGALFSYLFYLVGVGIAAASFGAAIGSGFMAMLGLESGLLVALVAGSGAIMMVLITLFLNLQKYIIIAMTALGGANAIVLAVLLLLGRVEIGSLAAAGNSIKPILQDSWFWLLVWAIVAAAGLVIQLQTNRTYTFSKERYQEGWG